MARFKPVCFSFICVALFFQTAAWSAVAVKDPVPERITAFLVHFLRQNSNKVIEQELGRKLLFKEKAALFAGRRIRPVTDPVKQANNQALIAFILSLVGLLIIPVLPSIAAIILSASALTRESKMPGTLTNANKSFATAGLVIGIVSILLLALVLAIVLRLSIR